MERARNATLVACFLHFDLSFMLWVLVGALGIPLAEAAHLSPSQKGLIVAVPILSGSLLRIPVGIIADRFGAKRVGLLMLGTLFIPLALAWQVSLSFPRLLGLGALIGIAGSSFAVALPLASRWFPPDRQGLAMGIAAAGNSGTVITNLLAPRLAASFGYPAVFAFAMAPLAVVLVLFAILAKEPPFPKAKRSPLTTLFSQKDLWWFCLFYAVTFGGYVGLGSFMPLLFRDQYGVTPVTAGYLTGGLAFAGSLSRPLGGILADRVGGTRLLSFLLGLIACGYALASRLPTLPLMGGLLGATMVCLGLGNGAVFQAVPLRFGKQIGTVTGIVGAIGGVGGFFLPTLLGTVRQSSGSFAGGFLGLAGLALVAAVTLRTLLLGSWRIGAVETSDASLEGAK